MISAVYVIQPHKCIVRFYNSVKIVNKAHPTYHMAEIIYTHLEYKSVTLDAHVFIAYTWPTSFNASHNLLDRFH